MARRQVGEAAEDFLNAHGVHEFLGEEDDGEFLAALAGDGAGDLEAAQQLVALRKPARGGGEFLGAFAFDEDDQRGGLQKAIDVGEAFKGPPFSIGAGGTDAGQLGARFGGGGASRGEAVVAHQFLAAALVGAGGVVVTGPIE